MLEIWCLNDHFTSAIHYPRENFGLPLRMRSMGLLKVQFLNIAGKVSKSIEIHF